MTNGMRYKVSKWTHAADYKLFRDAIEDRVLLGNEVADDVVKKAAVTATLDNDTRDSSVSFGIYNWSTMSVMVLQQI